MKVFVLALILVFGTSFANSQKYAYIDSDYILANVPAYTDAKTKLDKLADRWTKEIEKRYDVLSMKKENFAREEVLLPKEEKKKRKEEIETLELEAMQMQKVRFGVNGDYFQKRQELIKPIQDEVYDAMQEVASKRNYVFVFDKANQSNLVYADSKYDISNNVLKKMGFSVK
ncbi:MAG: OmpH family outer membrane protein [Crocinitomicaceae bacterium]|nr:OmpH family outer membrane protein [Crocinitomicaceae bacterium]MDG1777196.1 OmpH family outer membrane protein [Crocinitomicaceae bacterium]